MSTPSPPSRWQSLLRNPLLRSLGAALVLIVVLALVLWTREAPLARVQRTVKTAIPVGASRAEVAEWARRVGGRVSESGLPPPIAPAAEAEGEPFALVAGLSREEARRFLQIEIPWGTYRVWHDGSLATNVMWILLPINDEGTVQGHHFFTLEQLALHERDRHPRPRDVVPDAAPR